ncbi:hypothetical protein W97_06760 [Coniosporium apollinis CBS 100218]|uniref:Acetyl-CoA acyltransferase n=1 Tax=Coniosporium apollinis (strain CBS 100218) TaxID=1168221 RepID=R7Z0F6_CONA1|nr:uncharacterized protein W97_06760 [Coniosporium apollinis CBS 100218]EON67617.1 hypothetical protein W97_06760 [Coniosporium apollinis CBS 100218]
MTERVKQLLGHLSNRASAVDRLSTKNPDDVVVTMAFRTPLCKARKGGFKAMGSDELLLATFKAARARMGLLDPAVIQDITVGTVLTPEAPYAARAAALTAGFPETAAVQVINRFCSSGLMAISTVANAIRNQEIDCGLAVGYENMSANPDKGTQGFSEEIMACPAAADCKMPMGWTSENVAKEFNITREAMDLYAARSHTRAERARATGLFKEEIEPIEAWTRPADPDSSSPRTKVTVSEDDGIRTNTTPAGLAKIRSAFPQWPPAQTTGGNASQITDGGAAVLLMTRRKAEELGLVVLAKHVATSVTGLAPRIMGIGPALAIPRLMERTGLGIGEVDLFEINEAFASMYVYCIEKLGLDPEKVNVNGGAIALGHPLGCTGTRQVATGIAEARRRGSKTLVTSMCIGLGMGAAALWIVE